MEAIHSKKGQRGKKSFHFVSIDVTFFETTPFFLSSTIISQGEDDDLLVYIISSPAPTPAPVPIKPLITQVYSQRQIPPVSSPTPTVSSSDQFQNDDLLIVLRKGKKSVYSPNIFVCFQ